ncbi:MAG: histidine kinase N-terminal 7TM domain-containing protein [Smithellaceae bacterium]|nr:histidine kinase N-terminal 7TM domain-containing protein [Smithellaceae bacterium]
MIRQQITYTIFLLLATGINLSIGFYAWRKRQSAGDAALPFAFLMLAASLYTFGYAFELANRNLVGMLYWIKVEYWGIAVLPPLWTIVAICYVGRTNWLTKPLLVFLFAIPAATIIANYTNDWHHLLYSTAAVSTEGPFPTLSVTGGSWYWVHIFYSNLCLIVGNVLFARFWWNAPPSYRRQAATMLIGSIIPWIGFITYLSGKSPWGLDLSPMMFTATGPILVWGLFRYQLLDLEPIARDTVFDGMGEGVIVLDGLGRVVDYNRIAATTIKTLTPASLGLPAAKALQDYPVILDHLFAKSSANDEYMKITEEGDIRYFTVDTAAIRDRSGHQLGEMIILNEDTQKVMMLQELSRLATIDSQTDILNRRYFFELAQKELERAERYRRALSLVIMDIDHFKKVNDTFGHLAGDEVLQTVAGICKGMLRTSDIMGRYGGEEFAFILPETSAQAATQIAERLRDRIATAQTIYEGKEICVTASFGVAGIEEDEVMALTELLKRADKALYEAKETGRNLVICQERF